MCRLLLLLHTKQPINKLNLFLSQSDHNTKNTPGLNNKYDSTHNKDGFGFAWVEHNYRLQNTWKIYKNTVLYKDDLNLENKLYNIHSDIIIGHIRHKTIGSVDIKNTHPFTYKNQVFFHNGAIYQFDTYKITIKSYISSKYLTHIKGETDSEYLFYLFLTVKDNEIKNNNKDLKKIMQCFFDLVENLNLNVLANIIYADDKEVVITRYTINSRKNSLSLYYDNSDGIIISSEPVTSEYKLVREQSIIVLPIL